MMRSIPLTDDQRRWLADLYEANHKAVFRQCARIVRDPEEAADACQEVFVVATREFVAGNRPNNVRGWLLAVARNHCLDVLRRQKRFGKVLTRMGGSLYDSVNPETTVIGRQNVDAVLRGLSPRERLALWQSAVEHRPLADIASGLRLNYMAAAQVLSRARRHAALAMARVAAIFAVFRLCRRAAAHSMQLVAVLAVPVAIAAIQSSSSTVENSTSRAAAPPFVARGSGAVAVNVDQRGAHTSVAGLADNPLATVPGLPTGPGGTQSIDKSTLLQVTNAMPNLVRGLPPVPVVPINPTLPPAPKVQQ
jgi:RNA polymerase sigma factor (sigma-70 family)